MVKKKTDDDRIVIKKYANRRLYNTATSSYVTLEHLAKMVRDDVDFYVIDGKSGDDITRQVLTHIIVEEENKGENMLPLNFLRQLISLYGDNLQTLVPSYLDQTMQAFSGKQDQLRSMMGETFDGGDGNPMQVFENMARQNMTMFETAMKNFASFTPAAPANPAPSPTQQPDPEPKPQVDGMDAMRDQLNKLQEQLDKMTK